jgi:hypothetical protein
MSSLRGLVNDLPYLWPAKDPQAYHWTDRETERERGTEKENGQDAVEGWGWGGQWGGELNGTEFHPEPWTI